MSIDSAYTEVDRLIHRFKALSHAACLRHNEQNTRKDLFLPLLPATTGS